MRHNTKTSGDLAEILACAELIKAGYVVSRPLSDNASYDLIYDNGHCLRRAQVKGRSAVEDKIYVELYCNARSYTNAYVANDFDDLIIVDLISHKVALLDVSDGILFESKAQYKTLTLRMSDTSNKNIRKFDDYKIISA